MATELHRYKGKIISIKQKTTKKGPALGIMIESEKGNKAWFFGWEEPWAARGDGRCTPLIYEDQEVEVLSPPPDPGRNSVQKDEKTGGLLIFLAPNPKIDKITPVTEAMKRRVRYEQDLERFNSKRLARALVLFRDEMHQWIEDRDREFVTSLADGAKQYNTVTDAQRPFVIKILSRYAANHTKWGKIVDDSVKNVDTTEEEWTQPDEQVSIAEEDF